MNERQREDTANMPEELHRYGWMLHKDDDTFDMKVFSQPVTSEMLREFEELVAVICTLQPLATAFAICDREYAALASLAESQEARLNAIGTARVPLKTVFDLIVETSASVTAFLGGASAFLGQMEYALATHWGKTSEKYAVWNRKRQQRHAASLGYRVMYKLRNYSQHHAMPLSTLSVTGIRATSDAAMTFTCRPTLERDVLVASSFNWGPQRAELAAFPPAFDIVPLLTEYFECLQAIMLDAVQVFDQELRSCHDYLEVVRAS
ncbi:MAG: hypothetical protein IPP90_12400 [Gemmatimonadaceae bacterium]|nr:hypothetical protein [Gemmatimonadaceae bacterium]